MSRSIHTEMALIKLNGHKTKPKVMNVRNGMIGAGIDSSGRDLRVVEGERGEEGEGDSTECITYT